MGKRSDFARNPRDFYPTPYDATLPLLAHIKGSFIEPCAGDGRLIRHLKKHGHRCDWAGDIFPEGEGIVQNDVLFFNHGMPPCNQIITNPPWDREILHRMIDVFRMHAPTWLLLDADWAYTRQAIPFMAFCSKMVVVGRISWMDNDVSGMDNCCWYRFGDKPSQTIFITDRSSI